MRELLFVQPLDEPRARRVLARATRDPVPPERAIHAPGIQVERAAAQGERFGEPPRQLGRAGVRTGGYDGERPHQRPRAPRARA